MRLGADPEVFLMDNTGKHISAIGLVNANKWHPLQIEGMPPGFTLQEDNVALEFGIPPAASEDEWVSHIQAVMEKSKEWTKGLSFSKLSCTIFPEDQMNCPAAFRFGCEPDHDAWTGKENPKPQPPHQYMRSAGGHIHVETKMCPADTVKAMDLYLSVPATVMDNGEARKQLYGKKGAHRVKPYGVEYRSLSNFWIFDEKLIRWSWRATKRALENKVVLDKDMELYLDIAINQNDKGMAWALINEYNLEMV